MDPLHPTDPLHVGKYRLTARLGTGGMGQVYLARTPSGRKLVIKVIRPEFASEEGFRARFAREADAARRIGGFHTAQVVDTDPDADPPWIATAHIPGPTLGQAVREHGPLTPPALHILATGLIEGLDAIHRCGLVHRDLKPGNIILASDGPRIIDFGIARPLDADSLTTHSAVFGTLPYMSPEQTDSSRVGPASDVFSLGTVLAFAATGVNPFRGATMAATVRKIISRPPDPGDLDRMVRELIVECWEHVPDRRPTTAQILARFQKIDLEGSLPPVPKTSAKLTVEPEVQVQGIPRKRDIGVEEGTSSAKAPPDKEAPRVSPPQPPAQSDATEPEDGRPEQAISGDEHDYSQDVEMEGGDPVRRWWTIALLFTTIVITAVLGSFYFGRQYVESQYYIGVSPNGETVAVYQGIPTDIGGISLSQSIEETDLRLEDLTNADRTQIENIVHLEYLSEAPQLIAALREEVSE